MRLKASALYYSVIISLIIVVLIGGMVLLSYNYHGEVLSLYINQQLRNNANSGLNILLSDTSFENIDSSRAVMLFEDSGSSVILTKRIWGLYRINISSSSSKNRSLIIAALCGQPRQDSAVSLYLADHGKALSICGNTILKGPAFLPVAGVKRTFIEGQNYSGSQLVYGKIINSRVSLPELSKNVLDRNKALYHLVPLQKDSQYAYNKDAFDDSIIISFSARTVDLSSSGALRIGSKAVINGNVIISSSKYVVIEQGASLNDVLIYSPFIIIEDNFKGRIQAFASDSIMVGKNVQLDYPSSLSLLDDTTSKIIRSNSKTSKIKISEGSKVAGIVFVEKNTNADNYPAVSLEKNSLLTGTLFSSGSVQLKGKVLGNVYCDRIYLQTENSTYENCLLNTEINSNDLPAYFCNSNIMGAVSEQKVIRWLP